MLGWIRWGDGRRIRMKQECLLGMTVLALELPSRSNQRERTVKKAARLLPERRVTRVLVPPGFTWWPQLTRCGLRPVDTRALRCALAPAWVRACLAVHGVEAARAVLRLSGGRESSHMEQVARALCPMIRNLVIDVPGDGTLAAQLRREFGLPILPVGWERADLTLSFDPGPVLVGAEFKLDQADLPRQCEILPLLSVLWETGRVKPEEIVIQV